MIKRWFVLAALCMIFAGSAAAQQWSDVKLITNVPFDFVVNGTTLPAGTYVVRTYTTRALMIQNKENRAFATILRNNNLVLSAGKTCTSSGFIFKLDKGQHVLHQIRLEGDDHIHDIIHGNDVAELVARR